MTTYEQLESAIYFLKVPELKSLVAHAGLKASTSKQALINDLLAFAKGETYDHAKDKPKKSMRELEKMGAHYDPKTHIVPGVYTNNFYHKDLFRDMIGKHFSFTTYGMGWIRDQWQEGRCPTFEEFATYWQGEYERRKNTGDFKSPKTLQRVTLFRKLKDQNLSKDELEDAWYEERLRQADFAKETLHKIMDTGQPLSV